MHRIVAAFGAVPGLSHPSRAVLQFDLLGREIEVQA
jgi:hypothetical protein